MLTTLRDMMRPPPGMEFDFSQPAGEPALAPANSVSWTIFANPVSLFIGGVAALLPLGDTPPRQAARRLAQSDR